MADTGELDGIVEITPIERGLPEAIHRAEAARSSLALLLFRPSHQARPRSAFQGPTASDLTDLAAALTASLDDGQALFEAGKGYLAVVIESGPRGAAKALARRAGECGAPSFTWVASHYPRDGRSARGLAQLAAPQDARGHRGRYDPA